MFSFYCFWTPFCEPAPFGLGNIIYRLNQKVLITETNIETELPCIEINQKFELKYFRKCTYKTAKILIAALIHLLKLARKIIGLIFDSVWNVTFELKFSSRNYCNTVSFQVSIGSLTSKCLSLLGLITEVYIWGEERVNSPESLARFCNIPWSIWTDLAVFNF